MENFFDVLHVTLVAGYHETARGGEQQYANINGMRVRDICQPLTGLGKDIEGFRGSKSQNKCTTCYFNSSIKYGRRFNKTDRSASVINFARLSRVSLTLGSTILSDVFRLFVTTNDATLNLTGKRSLGTLISSAKNITQVNFAI